MDWARLGVVSADDPLLFERLGQASIQRQETLEEFSFLKKQIAWRKERYEQKAISINLAKRVAKKIEDEAYAKELNETFEALRENNYTSEAFLTKISEEQEALSAETLSADSETNPSVAETDSEEEEEQNFDIYLRETARILADWVQHLSQMGDSRLANKSP